MVFFFGGSHNDGKEKDAGSRSHCRQSQRAGTAAAQSCRARPERLLHQPERSAACPSLRPGTARGRGAAVSRRARLRARQPEPRRGHSRHQPRHPAQEIEAVRACRLLSRGPAHRRRVGGMRPMPPPVRRALLSASDKTGLIELAQALARRNIEILSTGGTARLLTHNGVPVREVAGYTGFPEIMDGRLKTLHPKIHGGLLGRRGVDDAVMAQHAIAPIDLLVVNLYPFEATVARPGCRYADAVEHIDIGGPAMLRAAAKNHESVLVVVDPADYPLLLAELDTHQGGSEFATRARLAAKAFSHTARYDALIAGYLSSQQALPGEPFPATLSLMFEKVRDLRYGENPHQRAALYRDPAGRGAGVAGARVLQGKDLSYNNIADADTAVQCVRQFTQAACVIVKHANPCGVALAATPLDAYEGAYRTDPTSAYGGIIAFNRELDAATATAIVARQFVEVLAAPAVDAAAARG